MAEFEEKLNSILGNQAAMEQIMLLARSLSGEQPQEQSVQELVPIGQGQGGQQEQGQMPDLSALLGQLDPAMLQLGMRLFQEYRGDDGRNAALLAALRPFLKEERRGRLDRAMEIARVTRLIRVALGAVGGKGEQGRV